jgi:hypothetical protein
VSSARTFLGWLSTAALVAARGLVLVMLVIVPVPVVVLFFKGKRGDRRAIAAQVIKREDHG